MDRNVARSLFSLHPDRPISSLRFLPYEGTRSSLSSPRPLSGPIRLLLEVLTTQTLASWLSRCLIIYLSSRGWNSYEGYREEIADDRRGILSVGFFLWWKERESIYSRISFDALPRVSLNYGSSKRRQSGFLLRGINERRRGRELLGTEAGVLARIGSVGIDFQCILKSERKRYCCIICDKTFTSIDSTTSLLGILWREYICRDKNYYIRYSWIKSLENRELEM